MRAARAVVGAVGAVAAVTLAGLAACGGNRTGEAGPLASDTIRGVVVLTGADPVSRVALRRDDTQIALSGAVADSLRAMDGLEVWLGGEALDDGGFRAETFRVRGMGRHPAVDGRLELDGDVAVLVTPAGERLRYPHAPVALRALEGRHVWIAGRTGREPEAWGPIAP